MTQEQFNLQVEKFFAKATKLETNVPYYELGSGNLGIELNVGELKITKLQNTKAPTPEGMFRFVADLPLTIKVKAEQTQIFEVFVLESMAFVSNLPELPASFDPLVLANLIAPYASSALKDLVSKSGYPQIDMPPLIFNRPPVPAPTVPDYNAAWKH